MLRRAGYDATGSDDPNDAEAAAKMAEQGPPDATEQPLNVEARFRHGAFVFRFKGTGIRAVSDKKRTVVVTLEELLTGVTRVLRLTRRVRCDACGGTGSARPDERKTCELCGGSEGLLVPRLALRARCTAAERESAR